MNRGHHGFVVLLVLAAGCVDPEIPPDGVSCQQDHALNVGGAPPELDLVIAISDAATMAPYRDRLVANLRDFGLAIADGGFDVHLTLVDISGPGVGDDACGDGPVVPYFKDWELPRWACAGGACGQRNYEGELGDRLACAAPASNQPQAPPLIQRIADAVDEPGFARRDAILGMILIGVDDDASPQPVGVYLDRIRRSRTDPDRIWVTTVLGPGATRLADLRAAFETRTVAIDDADWTDAVAFASYKTDLAISCLDDQGVLDLEPKRPGIQPQCVVHDDGLAVPRCRMASPDLPDPDVLPCYWVQVHAWGCSAPTVERARVEPAGTATMSCACDL